MVLANDACLDTIPRTINTGLGALFILTALYFLGGETLTDFALALIVGILVGTYSSVFTAAPLAVAFDRLSPAPVPAATARETALRRAREEPASVPAPPGAGAARRTTAGVQPARKRAGTARRKRRRRR
jgi:SecD/SecF fusion protein